MRVLLVATHLEIGGISVYVVSLAKALTRRGHKVWVISSGGSMQEDLKGSGVEHLQIPLRVKSELHPRVFKAVFRLAAVVRERQIDLIHAHTRVGHVSSVLAGYLTGVPVVTTCHGFYRWHLARKIFPFWGRRVMAVSKIVRRRLTMRFRVPNRKVVYIPNGIEWEENGQDSLRTQVDIYKTMWGISSTKPVIGSIARLVPAKGHETLIRAFHELRKKVPEAQLVLVGEGPLREKLVELIYELGEQDHVVTTGSVPRTAVPLSAFTVFVQASVREAFGLSLVEAMAMRLPVVASSVGGMREIVEEGKTGFKVSSRDPAALAAAIQKIIENKDLAKAMGQAGYERYRRMFTMDRVAEQVESVYQQAIQGN